VILQKLRILFAKHNFGAHFVIGTCRTVSLLAAGWARTSGRVIGPR
jgi:hypothetical protein